MSRPLLTRIPARQWLTVLLGGVACLALWQVWLTVRLLEQDQSLELQRSRERLGEIADLALAQLSRSLGDWELGLHELNAFPPSPTIRARFPKGATFILISRDGIKVYPQRPLLFTPAPPVVHAQTPGAFDVADELELREQQYDRAIAALKPLTLRPATRPEALLRIARIQNKSDRQEDALNTYKSLASETAPDPSETLFALLAASNLANPWVRNATRFFIAVERAIPEAVILILLIAAFGLGAMPGVVALSLGCIGMLGKLLADVIEGIDPLLIESMESVGGNKAQVIVFGVLPQILPNIISYTLFRFDINIRLSVLLGAVGAGGIGYELDYSFGMLDYHRAFTAMIFIIVIVFGTERLSYYLRKKIKMEGALT